MKILRCIVKLIVKVLAFLFALLIVIIVNPLRSLFLLILMSIVLILTWIFAFFILQAFTDNPSTTAVTLTSILLFVVLNIVAYIKDKLEM